MSSKNTGVAVCQVQIKHSACSTGKRLHAFIVTSQTINIFIYTEPVLFQSKMGTLAKTTVQRHPLFFQSLPANQNGNRIYKYLRRFHSTLPPILLTLKMETESTSTWSDFIPHFLPFCRLLGLLLLCDTETKITSTTWQ